MCGWVGLCEVSRVGCGGGGGGEGGVGVELHIDIN